MDGMDGAMDGMDGGMDMEGMDAEQMQQQMQMNQ